MFELTHGFIETWGTGGAAFRNLYKGFLEELLIHPELKEGPRAWNGAEFSILKDCLPSITDSAYNWTLFAETLKNLLIAGGSAFIPAWKAVRSEFLI